MSMLTGESVSVDDAGSEIGGATVNASGRLIVRNQKSAPTTTLARMARLVENAQTGARCSCASSSARRRARARRDHVGRGDALGGRREWST
jgi:hypothetical protein